MNREQRSTMWCLFAAALLGRGISPANAAKDADAALKEFDKRFNCPNCEGKGRIDHDTVCPTCKGKGGQ